MPGRVIEIAYAPVGAHTELAASSAQTITTPTGARRLLIQALSQNVRFTLDGTVPTATKGFQLKAGDPPVIIPVGPNVTVKVIQETATAEIEYQHLN